MIAKNSSEQSCRIAQINDWPRKAGKMDYIRFLRGERLTRSEAIRAKCYECVVGEDTQPCPVKTCPLIEYCQWSQYAEERQTVDINT